MNSTTPQYVTSCETVTMELAYSEVCMHMRVAGQVRQVTFLDTPGGATAQILNEDGRPFSFPILAGEAGFYRVRDGLQVGRWYFYPPATTGTDGN